MELDLIEFVSEQSCYPHLVGCPEQGKILEVYRQCEDFLALGPRPNATLEMVQEDIDYSFKEGGRYCGIQLPDGQLIGVVDFIPTGYAGDPAAAFINLLMIASPHRSQRYGTAVLQGVEKEICRDQRVKRILTAVQVNNPAAIRFWRRMGYRAMEIPIHNPDGTTVYLLLKSVESAG